MSKLIWILFFYGFAWVITLLPLRVLYIFSDLLFLIFYYLFPYRKHVVVANLENAFPEKSPDEIQKISRKFYRHLCDQALETFKLIHMPKSMLRKRFNYTNPEMLEELYQSGRSVLTLCGHHSTWQFIVGLPMVTKHKFIGVYKPLSFKEFSNLYHYVCSKYGTLPVTMNDIYRIMLDHKSRNVATATFFLGDQRPRPGNIKYWTTFLNQDTPAITGFERIAKKLDQAVIYIDIFYRKRGYYDVTFRKICDNPREFKDYDITEAYLRMLEQTITDRPEFWLWTHKRWKHKREAMH